MQVPSTSSRGSCWRVLSSRSSLGRQVMLSKRQTEAYRRRLVHKDFKPFEYHSIAKARLRSSKTPIPKTVVAAEKRLQVGEVNKSPAVTSMTAAVAPCTP